MNSELTDAEFLARLEARTAIVAKWHNARKSAKNKLVALGLTEEEASSIFDGPQQENN